jgi:hypothetical protein
MGGIMTKATVKRILLHPVLLVPLALFGFVNLIYSGVELFGVLGLIQRETASKSAVAGIARKMFVLSSVNV